MRPTKQRDYFQQKCTVEGELQNWRQKRKKNAEAENLQLELHRKSMKGNGNFTSSRRPKFQNSASPGSGHLNSFTIEKKNKVMPNLAKLFSGKRNDNDLKAA